jgi:hypothetical protein
MIADTEDALTLSQIDDDRAETPVLAPLFAWVAPLDDAAWAATGRATSALTKPTRRTRESRESR